MIRNFLQHRTLVTFSLFENDSTQETDLLFFNKYVMNKATI